MYAGRKGPSRRGAEKTRFGPFLQLGEPVLVTSSVRNAPEPCRAGASAPTFENGWTARGTEDGGQIMTQYQFCVVVHVPPWPVNTAYLGLAARALAWASKALALN